MAHLENSERKGRVLYLKPLVSVNATQIYSECTTSRYTVFFHILFRSIMSQPNTNSQQQWKGCRPQRSNNRFPNHIIHQLKIVKQPVIIMLCQQSFYVRNTEKVGKITLPESRMHRWCWLQAPCWSSPLSGLGSLEGSHEMWHTWGTTSAND